MRIIKSLLIAGCMSLLWSCGVEKYESQSEHDESVHKGHTSDLTAGIDSLNVMMAAMKPGMDSMMAVKLTENMDVDFALMMIPHHQAAIDMSNALLPYAKDSFVTRVAADIISSQQQEIATMKAFAENAQRNGPLAKNAPANQMHHMNKMMQSMHGIKSTGNIEKDYVAMMIPHHQGAIDMAQMEIDNGKDPGMKALAAEIIKAQKNEIAQFNDWLKRQ